MLFILFSICLAIFPECAHMQDKYLGDCVVEKPTLHVEIHNETALAADCQAINLNCYHLVYFQITLDDLVISKVVQYIHSNNPGEHHDIRENVEIIEAYPDIRELDLNPVLVHEKGLSIADARIILKDASSGQD